MINYHRYKEGERSIERSLQDWGEVMGAPIKMKIERQLENRSSFPIFDK
jgi:hypothetical protein